MVAGRCYTLDQTNAISLRHNYPNDRLGRIYVFVYFLVTLKGARSHLVSCRLGVCVYCAGRLGAKLYTLDQTNAISLRHICVCVYLW